MENSDIKKPFIKIYVTGAPDSHKVAVTLEELGLPYEAKSMDLMNGEHKEEWFLKFNPNGRVPAIVDSSNNDFAMFESCAILLYLIDKYDKENKLSYPKESNLYYEMVSWLFFQSSGIGPNQGNSTHFLRYAPEKIEYAHKRFFNEIRRLYSILDKRIKENGGWLVGDKFTIADIASFTWVNFAFWGEIDLKEFPNLEEWLDRINGREAVKRGLDVPFKFELRERFMTNREEAIKAATANGSWILKAQEANAKKKYNE